MPLLILCFEHGGGKGGRRTGYWSCLRGHWPRPVGWETTRRREEAARVEEKRPHHTQTLAAAALGGENGSLVGGLTFIGMYEGAVSEAAHVPM
ncbi:hypothetical protein CgunFtcFv8_014201 [Champsocephalus gunnari]|uniref:Uncharacterized protein n=1 Tax=Champsocephalus gunnari TaxID=52237 RepID=A0AAN8HZQ4_CHAGU|nr:hypothetical protein CgunFtcFv8_014201 [Champsocephalus gunnari]